MVTLAREDRPPAAARLRVEMLGAFGSGKTTLAARLAPESGELLLEHPRDNPFWDDEHAVSVAGPIAYEIGFLVQHAHLAARAGVGGVGLCDWSFDSDLLWASRRLGEDLAAYAAVHRSILARVGAPLGYLYLKQPEEVVASRLRDRGIEAELPLLDTLPDTISRLDALVRGLPGDRVLVVNDRFTPGGLLRQVRRWMELP